jgi:uncharacterized repeat protein (TIGR01451 family)
MRVVWNVERVLKHLQDLRRRPRGRGWVMRWVSFVGSVSIRSSWRNRQIPPEREVGVSHLSSIVRTALQRKTLVGLFAGVVSIAVLQCGVALAAPLPPVSTDFEAPTFSACTPLMPVLGPTVPTCGSVNGQDGWHSAVPGDIPSLPNGYDQQVVVNTELAAITGQPAPFSFGAQSLRLSNGYNQGNAGPPEFQFQTYSKPTTDAGESLPNTEYIGEFSFISVHPDRQQPGLFISVSPDDGVGGRMSYVSLEDVPTGIDVTFYDTTADGDFVGTDLGILPRDVPHTITFWMKLNPGIANDLVRVYIDGKDFGQCFTTWENYYRAPPGPPFYGEGREPPVSNSLEFRSTGAQEDQSLVGGGYLFDNVKIKTDNGPGPPGCDVPIDKLPGAPSVTAGGLAHYRIIVHNRGRLTERYLLVCDHIPRETTFVSATPTLRRLGRRRCLFIRSLRPGQRSGFHIVLRVTANAHPGTLDNTVDETPEQPPGVPPATPVPPMSPEAPALPPGAVTETPPAIAKAKAIVRVLAKARVRRPAPPSFTG